MKTALPWILLGITITIILYLVFKPIHSVDNKDLIHKVDSTEKENKFLHQFVNAQLNNFSHYKDSTTHVIDSLQGRNIDLKSIINIANQDKRDLANQIIHRIPNESIDSPCVELARKVISDSLTVIDYQKNTDRLIFSFSDAVSKRDTIIRQQQSLILSDSILISGQKDLYKLQENQLKKSQRQAKTSAWLGRSLAVVSLVLGGILLAK